MFNTTNRLCYIGPEMRKEIRPFKITLVRPIGRCNNTIYSVRTLDLVGYVGYAYNFNSLKEALDYYNKERI